MNSQAKKYKLVIIDDEQEIREKMRRMIELSDTDFEIVGEYENGIEAYDGILSVQPELMVTDIKIPYVDGLETIRRVQEVMPLIKSVVTTGFDEYDYAKTAANLGVIGFINKPISQSEIRDILIKAQAQLDHEFSISENIKQLQEFHQKNLPILRENDLCRLLAMAEVSEAFRRKLLSDGVDLGFRFAMLGVFEFRRLEEGDDEYAKQESAFASLKLAFEDVSFSSHSYAFLRSDQLFVLLLSDERFKLSDVESFFLMQIERVKRRFGKSLRAGLSDIAECAACALDPDRTSHNFKTMRDEALKALEYRALVGGGKVFSFGNIPAMRSGVKLDENEFNDFEYILRHKDFEEGKKRLDHIFRTVVEQAADGSYLYFTTSILNRMIHACHDLNALHREYGQGDEMHKQVFSFASLEEAREYLHRVLHSVRRINEEAVRESVGSSLKRVTDYIDLHYPNSDLCLEQVSEQTNLSISYINTLLKRENTTFVKYVTALRMRKAIDLLTDKNHKIVEISEMVGYSDPYYFSHCFKKHTGVSPKEYRNQVRDE
ncbi:MAG: response regulator [Bacillota bacterium]|nr:response regulator [Bacillota bacterium]